MAHGTAHNLPNMIASLVVGGDHGHVHDAARVTASLLSDDTLLVVHATFNGHLRGSGSLWWHTERVLAACCAARVVVNAERLPLNKVGAGLNTTELLAAHLSNLELCTRPSMPCSNDFPGAMHILLLAPDVMLYRRGVEQYVTRNSLSVGVEAVASGSFCRMRHIRPLLGLALSGPQMLLAWGRRLRAAQRDANGVGIGTSIAMRALATEGNATPGPTHHTSREAHDYALLLPPGQMQVDTSHLADARSTLRIAPRHGWQLPFAYNGNCSVAESTCAFNARGFSHCKTAVGRGRGGHTADACAAARSLPTSRPQQPARFAVACLGDSHTSGVGATSRRWSYPVQLQTKLSAEAPFSESGVVVTNLGAPAAKVGQPLGRLPRAKEAVASYWRMPHLEAATNGTFDAMVFMFGANDLRAEPGDGHVALGYHSVGRCSNASEIAHLARHAADRELYLMAGKGGQPNGSPGWFKYVCVRFVRDYLALINRVRQRRTAPSMMLLVVPPHALFDAACGIDTHALLHLLPTLIKAVAIAADLPPPLDPRPHLGIRDHLRLPLACTRLSREPADHCRLWTCDRVHLSDRGQQVLASAIADEIRSRHFTSKRSISVGIGAQPQHTTASWRGQSE